MKIIYLILKNIKKLNIIIKVVVIIIIISLIIFLVIKWLKSIQSLPQNKNQQLENISIINIPSNNASTSSLIATSTKNNLNLYLPISEALTRVTKKPFGLYVSPKNSPVNPEHFIGYHTGVDFETKPEERDIEVPIYAICTGPLVLKKIATGYGGVAVQACEINKEPVTVIYGHLRLASVTALLKESLNQGQPIGLLGKGYSAETAGERKHLHLGIHQGTTINLLGYVQNKSELDQWLDFLTLVE